MKFVLVILALHFIGEMIGTKKEPTKDQKAGDPIRHPAEYDLR